MKWKSENNSIQKECSLCCNSTAFVDLANANFIWCCHHRVFPNSYYMYIYISLLFFPNSSFLLLLRFLTSTFLFLFSLFFFSHILSHTLSYSYSYYFSSFFSHTLSYYFFSSSITFSHKHFYSYSYSFSSSSLHLSNH